MLIFLEKTVWKLNRFFIIGLSLFASSHLSAQDKTYVAPDVNVISVSPVQGSGINIERVPSNVQSFGVDSLSKKKNFSVVETLNREASGISISNLNSSPMQNDINFRGYVSGPLLGTAQAMAIYQNGMRVNESFGEVVQWDLVPDFAINNMQVFSGGDPIFGQNAIGGAISLQMKSGFENEGAKTTFSGGSYGRTNEILEYGKNFGDYAVYLGANFNVDKGWRDKSESYLETFYSDFRYRGEDTELFLNIGQAFTDLRGNGAVPLTLMDMEGRDAVYTYPDNTHNKNYYANMGGNHIVNDNLSFQGNMYYRHMERRNYNGDEFEGKDCGLNFDRGGGAANGTLCGEYESNAAADGVPLLSASGGINYVRLGLELDDDENEIENFGAINRSNTKQDAFGLNFQTTYDSKFFGYSNTFIGGVNYDFSHNSFGSSTELGIIQADRGVQGTGVFVVTDEEGEEQFVTNLESTTHNTALYGSNTFDLNNTISVNVSARWNWASMEMNDQHGTALNGHHYFWRINPGIGIVKRLNDVPLVGSTRLFASYKESSRTPSVAELACADPNAPCRLPNSFQADPPLDQVVNRNFEIGANGTTSGYQLMGMDHSIKWNVSGYAGRNYSDIIFIGGNRVGTGYFRNVGNTQRIGAEFALNGQLGEKWTWFSKYAYVRATFETSQMISSVGHPSNTFDDDNFADNELRESYQIPIKHGKKIPGISPHIGRFGLGYAFKKNWTFSADIEASSSQFYRGDEDNTAGTKLPGYLLTNLGTEYNFSMGNKFRTGANGTFFLTARNIFGVNYETGGIFAENEVSGTGGSGTFVTPGQPRVIFAGVNVTW